MWSSAIHPNLLNLLMGKSSNKRTCIHCNQSFSSRGFSNHVAACQRLLLTEEPSFTVSTIVDQNLRDSKKVFTLNGISNALTGPSRSDTPTPLLDNDEPNLPLTTEDTSAVEFSDGPNVDDIKTEYHPFSGLQPSVQPFQDYIPTQSPCPDPSIPNEPWQPFRSRLDFEIAELILGTNMNTKQINTLCSLFRRAISGTENFTLRGDKDLRNIWSHAASKWAPVCPISSQGNPFTTFPLVSKDPYHSTVEQWKAQLQLHWSRFVGLGNGSCARSPASTSFSLGCSVSL